MEGFFDAGPIADCERESKRNWQKAAGRAGG
jgi:hypothetical protein